MKLQAPLPGADFVPRDHLIARLQPHKPLTLIVAPAGYGKTTLVAAWLRQIETPAAWLTLDGSDDSLRAFMRALLAAVRTRFPHAAPRTAALIQSGHPPLPSMMAQVWVEEVRALPDRLVLVLDDYHQIRDLAVHQVMTDLLHFQPPGLALVLTARHDPPLPLPALRARNRVTEIRAADLRFSLDEAVALAAGAPQRQGCTAPPDQAALARLHTWTGGWPAALRLAAHLAWDVGAPPGESPQPDARPVNIEALVTAVLAQQPASMRELLIRSAILDELCAPLCAALLAQDAAGADAGADADARASRASLEALADAGIFLSTFDMQEGGDAPDGAGDAPHERWHRWQPLVRLVLQAHAAQQLPPAALASLHTRAARWLEAHGYLDLALAHAVQAGDGALVAGLVGKHRHARKNEAAWAELAGWQRLIPRAMQDAHPQLRMLEIWGLSRMGRLDEAAAAVRATEALLERKPLPPAEALPLAAEISALRSQIGVRAADEGALLAHTQSALAHLPHTWSTPRALAWVAHSLGLEMQGDAAGADAALAEALAESLTAPGRYMQAHLLVGACLVAWQRADMALLAQQADRLLRLAQSQAHLESLARGLYFRGAACYQQNDLEGALRDFSAVAPFELIADWFAYTQAQLGLASTLHALGRAQEAETLLAEMIRRLRSVEHSALAAQAEALRALLALRRGARDGAAAWLALSQPLQPPGMIRTFASVELARIAILLGLGDPGSVHGAGERLAALRPTLERQHNQRFLLEAWALHAAWLARSGAPEAALALLDQAVARAVAGGAVRALADLGFVLDPLLDRLHGESAHLSRIGRIRRAAGSAAKDGPAADAHVAHTAPGSAAEGRRALLSVRIPTLFESLTAREMDVLLLLSDRPSNKEIARALSISTETVKRHMGNIFRKLQVENRRQAVSEARRLALLPPP